MLPIKSPLGPQLVTVSEESNLTAADLLLKKSKGLPLVVLNLNKEISGFLTTRKLNEADVSKNGEKKVKTLINCVALVVPKDILLKDLCQRMINETIAGFLSPAVARRQ